MQKKTMNELEKSSYLSGGNAAYLEEIYDQYLANPSSVDKEWRDYFQSLPAVGNNAIKDVSHEAILEQLRESAHLPKVAAMAIPFAAEQERVDNLIDAYRSYGHIAAQLDPLGLSQASDPRLELSHYALGTSDMSKTFATRGVLPKAEASLQEIVDRLKSIYCGTLAFETSFIENSEEQQWLQDYIEVKLPQVEFDALHSKKILKRLLAAEDLEKYLDVKYVGQKRFSLEGGESMIPMLDELNEKAAMVNTHEVIIGMAHRARLNVLLNIMGKTSKELFQEFEGAKDYGMTSGDVKYHMGYSSDIQTSSGPIHLSLGFNPSHLEFISPVVMGSVRARQDRESDKEHNYALTVMIHGDSAFTGQGVVMETLNMSKVRAYDVGGSVHLIFNNQVGFTTSDPLDLRSARYCSGPAKMIEAPIIHVNGDDPEAAIKAMQLAMDYRHRFKKDVVVDLVCYRLHGHNESDEPSATQPLMYKVIRARKSVPELYAQKLIQAGIVTEAEVAEWNKNYVDLLDQGARVTEILPEGITDKNAALWNSFMNQDLFMPCNTAISLTQLDQLTERLTQLPPSFELQRQVGQVMAVRKKMWAGELPLDWGAAETMAYASILEEGHLVRFTGEDSRRGTFSHRHAALFDQKTGEAYLPLAHLSDKQAAIEIYDSSLSETSVLAFEYGYSTTDPQALVIWEAQFGDFANGAQVIIDQFISSAWQKWQRLSGLVMMLPHGYEGMGPEHSSARLERYLQLAAQDNMQICIPTTPSQIFHLLRRQVMRPVRVPLIIMTPKSLLRHKLAVSPREALTKGEFQLVIPEIDTDIDANKVRRVVVCSGKVYYDLLAKRRENKQTDVAIIRIEQLYPFPYEAFKAELQKYAQAKEVVWCQEEPMNQGAWYIGRHRLVECMRSDQTLIYAGREAMAATAPGYPALHNKQQNALVDAALK